MKDPLLQDPSRRAAMTRTARLTPPLAVIFGLLLACRGTEGPTSPLRESTRLTAVGALADKGAANNQANGNNRPGQGHADTVVTVKRLTPLSTRITTMAWIGPAGGTISLARTGVIVAVPAGPVALPAPFSGTHTTLNPSAGYVPPPPS